MGVLLEGLRISALGLGVVFASLGILALVIWAIGRTLGGAEEEVAGAAPEEEVAAAVAAVLSTLPSAGDRENWLRNSLSRRRRR